MELIQNTVDHWDEYDTVLIGYPIWRDIAAWPTDAFVKANHFTGKTVVTFCTAFSSGIGESRDILEEMTGTGNWIAFFGSKCYNNHVTNLNLAGE